MDRPSTPPPARAYEVNQEVILMSALGGPFNEETRVKIVKVKDNNTTGHTSPLTAYNAVYKVSTIVEKEVVLEVLPSVEAEALHHQFLNKLDPSGVPSSKLYSVGDHVYLNIDWKYRNIEGEYIELPRGTRLEVDQHGPRTKTGGEIVTSPQDAYYSLSVVKTELRLVEEIAPVYVPHQLLKKPNGYLWQSWDHYWNKAQQWLQ